MSNRQIHNYKSEILVEETVEKYGYHPDILGDTSNKFVVARCRFCGKNHDIRKGFFNKTGSACHKECKVEEMKLQKSPFTDKKVREKAKKKIKERYGVEYASQNKEVAKKISNVRSSKNNKDKIRKTNIDKYGVENPFQSEDIKGKIKETNKERYGFEHPMQNGNIKKKMLETNIDKYGVDNPLKSEVIKDKIKKTNREKYGVENPQQNKDIKNRTLEKYKETISNNNEYYKMINILRSDSFWKDLKNNDLQYICKKYDLDYQSLTAALLRDEFKDKYYSIYSFPKQQKQKELYDWLKEEGANVGYNDRSVISPLELDIVDKDKKVAIEFNGSFWHSEGFLDRDEAKNKHYNKTILCQEEGYRLIHVFEHTYLSKEKQVKNYLRSCFGLNKKKIAARKCKVTNDNSNKFINEYHIQDSPRGTIQYFNLEYDGEIVGSMTAGKHHEKGGDNKACILTRLVFKDNITVQGGSSKLFSAFKKWAVEEGYEKIISWSDNIYSEGNIYDVLGFELEDEYVPSYFYFDRKNGKYCTKQSQRKTNKLRPEGTTIKDWNNSREMYVIWDCGKKKWTYYLNKKQHCKDKDVLELIDKIQDNITFDMIKKEYRGKTPIHGACYIASETFYHMYGKQLDIKRYKLDNGVVHWWLEKDGEVIDLTKEQFDFRVPYELGKGGTFLTKKPSKRCQKLIDKIKVL